MSIEPVGFDSRCCFCLWSKGDVERVVRDNHKTYLHILWGENHFYVDHEYDDDKVTLSFCRVLWSVAAYPIGMLGYLMDTVVKVILLIGNFFTFMIALIGSHSEWRHDRGVILLDNLAAFAICLVGIVIPPLAYRLDRSVKTCFLNSL